MHAPRLFRGVAKLLLLGLLSPLFSTAYTDTYEVRDRDGIPVLEISKLNLFGRFSEYFNAKVADFRFAAKPVGQFANISKTEQVLIAVTIHRNDGTEYQFPVKFLLNGDAEVTVSHYVGAEYNSSTFKSIEFTLTPDFQPIKERIAARQKTARQAAVRKAKVAEERAQDEKARAVAEARQAEERAKLRAACAAIYRKTADIKLKDLTVREEQQVRACQALGLYPPQ